MRTAELTRTAPLARARGQLREGLRYVRGRADLMLPILLVGVIGTFGLNFQLTLGLMARAEFHKGAREFGLLTSALAVGSLLGALLAARRVGVRQRLLLGSAVAFALLEIAAGFAPGFVSLALLLVPTGMAVLTFTTAANATVQLGAAPEMRGRVMALYILVFLGGTPIGAPAIGVLAQAYGPRAGLVVGGALCLVCSLAVAAVAAVLARRHSEPTPGAAGRRVTRPGGLPGVEVCVLSDRPRVAAVAVDNPRWAGRLSPDWRHGARGPARRPG